MEKNNKKKRNQLGMPLGTASHRLRKLIMFSLLNDLGRTRCYRCKKHIESAADLSVDHIESWLDSDDPVGKFFDISNISFSHLKCNSGAGNKSRGREAEHGTKTCYDKWGCRCDKCKEAKSRSNKKYRGV